MSSSRVDLLIIGAGITGAAIARDAAMRGIRTALVDRSDFGSGTSSRSSRLIHGGLRYLEHGQLRLVFEASRERRILLKIAPHLVRPRSFLFPVHEGSRVPLWKLSAGLWLYDLLSMFRNVKRHKTLSRQAMRRAEPGLKDRGLKGGARYYDAQCDDARLTLATVRSAYRYGAMPANYVDVAVLEIADGRVRGARCTDLPSGREFSISASVVVNATGPWSDGLRAGDTGDRALRPTKGAHVAVRRERIGNQEAITITSPIDGRVMFIIPWGEYCYIGTTDTDCGDEPERVYADGDDVVYLLRSANAMFPSARLTPKDVVSTWAGLRPLLAPDNPADPSSVSREHRILESESGLLSIVGGKLTTHRVMGTQMVDRVARQLHKVDGRRVAPRPRTDVEPLPGGESHDLNVLIEEAIHEGFDRQIAEHLVAAYGTETPAICRLALSEPALAQPIIPGHPAMNAELIHAIRREMAITLKDLLIRRTHIFYETTDHGLSRIDEVAELVGKEMGWDSHRRDAEVAAYREEVDRSTAFRQEIDM